MQVCMHVCMYVCCMNELHGLYYIYMYVCMYVCFYYFLLNTDNIKYTIKTLSLCMYVLYVCMYVCMYVMHVCSYVCMYVCAEKRINFQSKYPQGCFLPWTLSRWCRGLPRLWEIKCRSLYRGYRGF